MITEKNIETMFADCADLGYEVTYKDIVYCLIRDKFEDVTIAYISVFGGDGESVATQAKIYDGSGKITFLKAHLSLYEEKPKKRNKKDEPLITYDENLAYMIKLKNETEQAKASGDMESKDALKLLTDITCKINDKFKVNDDNKGQVVIVETKYNDICEYCQHEIARAPMTKEEAMNTYNLIEK